MDIERIAGKLRQNTNPQRYEHSLRVAETARALAQRFGQDGERAYLAGLLHDCAKHLSDEETLRLAAQAGIRPDLAQAAVPRVLLHGPVGAVLARTLYGVTVEAVLQAIARHQSGAADMTPLDNLVRLADMIEPGRSGGTAETLRALAQRSPEAALLHGLRVKIPELIAQGRYLEHHLCAYYNQLLRHEEPLAAQASAKG